jgi:hypothetical protein
MIMVSWIIDALIYGVDNNETIKQIVDKYVTLNNSYICKIHKCININELVGRKNKQFDNFIIHCDLCLTQKY